MASYDFIGNIAVMKFGKEKKKEKIKLAKQLLKRKNITTVVEKSDKVRGRLRTLKTKHLVGEKTLETLYKENGCKFRLNIETCYFSPRLSEERKEIASLVRKKDRVLVLFSGVDPYAILIAKKAKEVVSIELSRACDKYAKTNIKLNHLSNLTHIQGDVKKVIEKQKRKLGKFDVIVMPRPNLKNSFLEDGFKLVKKGTKIHYYCFGHEDKLGKLIKQVHEESKKAKKKIKILKIKKAGNIAPYKFRYRVDILVL